MWIFKWPSTIYLKDHSFTLLWKSKWHLTVTLVLNQVTVCFWTLCSIDLSVYLWHPTPVLLPGKSHGWRSLVGCSPWDHEESKSQTWLSDFTFSFLFPLYALEKEMATHSSVLAWRIPGTAEPGGLPSMGLHRVGHDWSDLAAAVAAAWNLEKWHQSIYLQDRNRGTDIESESVDTDREGKGGQAEKVALTYKHCYV